jgi:hypothetical protein
MSDFWDMAMMMEAVNVSETSVYFYETKRRYIPDTCQCRENLKSHIKYFISDKNYMFEVGSLFYDAFSVTRLYSVDDRVISE